MAVHDPDALRLEVDGRCRHEQVHEMLVAVFADPGDLLPEVVAFWKGRSDVRPGVVARLAEGAAADAAPEVLEDFPGLLFHVVRHHFRLFAFGIG